MKYGDRVLFDPDWGTYDMAVGERDQFGLQRRGRQGCLQSGGAGAERTDHQGSIRCEAQTTLKTSTRRFARFAKAKTGYERLGEIWETQQAEHPEDWLLSMEIFEILDTTNQQPDLKARIEKFLNSKKASTKDFRH